MAERDGSLAVFGIDPPAIRLLIAAILCAELEDYVINPANERDVSQEIADKAEKYAQYLSLFFIVSRRKKCRTSKTISTRLMTGQDGLEHTEQLLNSADQTTQRTAETLHQDL